MHSASDRLVLLLKALRRIGIDLAPYVIYVEQGPMPRASVGQSFEQSLITAANIEHVLARYGSEVNAQKWRARVGGGEHGLLLEHGGALVGYTWASESRFLGIDNRPLFELAAHEAYLFDTFVAPGFRGRGIAGLLRELMCSRLEAFGRNTFLSFTLAHNAPARRFKEKLAARPLEMRVRARLFGRWFVDARLRQWQPRVPVKLSYGRLSRRAGGS